MTDNDKKTRLEGAIDANLKKVYQEALDEEIPDRFMDLLDRLKAQEEAKNQSGESEPK